MHSLEWSYWLNILGSTHITAIVTALCMLACRKTETSLFAHDDNFDAEVRRKYMFHQRVEYFHRQFMEAKQTGEPIATLRKRLALETVNIGAGKGKKKDDGEMHQTWWRLLQGVSDERKLSILLRVDSGELSLDHMTLECARCKTLDVIMKSFCHLTGCKDWTEAQAKCGPYSTDERLYSFEKSFDLMLKDRSSSNSITKALFGVDEPEPKGGKCKRASEAKSLVQVLPPEFLDHIDSARAYKEAKEARRAVPVPDQNYKHWVKEGSLQSVKWDVFHGDETVDDVIRLEKDQVQGSAGTGGREADDGTEDPEGIDPGVHAEEAEEAGEEVPEHEQNLGQEGIVPDSLVAE
ncbi:hypothetical protein R1sor_004803 [Riccia sorocarpa]|uniref:Uncharacterized protein n=1 Tax=Riccia sorocarpa TaxID=122646 RepID=A0ABD3HL85_9MARC